MKSSALVELSVFPPTSAFLGRAVRNRTNNTRGTVDNEGLLPRSGCIRQPFLDTVGTPETGQRRSSGQADGRILEQYIQHPGEIVGACDAPSELSLYERHYSPRPPPGKQPAGWSLCIEHSESNGDAMRGLHSGRSGGHITDRCRNGNRPDFDTAREPSPPQPMTPNQIFFQPPEICAGSSAASRVPSNLVNKPIGL